MAGGEGGAAPAPKQDEWQPYPTKEQLPNMSYCITSPPQWPNRDMVDIGEDPFLFSNQFHPLDFSCSSFGSSPYTREPLLEYGLREAVVPPFINSSMDEDDFLSQLNELEEAEKQQIVMHENGEGMSSTGTDHVDVGGLNPMRVGLEGEKQQIGMNDKGEGMISCCSRSISSTGSDHEESMTKLKRVKTLSRTNLSRYFYMSISDAAKELKVGLTQLKRRCRELGIPRWPYRKLMSLQVVIKNVQELVEGEGVCGDMKIREALRFLEEQRKWRHRSALQEMEEGEGVGRDMEIRDRLSVVEEQRKWTQRKVMTLQTVMTNVQEMGAGEGFGGDMKIKDALSLLEEERKLMEEMPEVDLQEKTKKLRQAWFKANCMKRKETNCKKRKEMTPEWHPVAISRLN